MYCSISDSAAESPRIPRRSAAKRDGYDIVVPSMDATDGPGDGELINRITGGDTEAFELLYDRHRAAAYGLALRMLAEPPAAEDVVQEAFLTVWRQAASYGPARGTVRAWLLAIVHHRAIDYLRRRALREDRQDNIEDMALPAESADTWELARQNVEGQQVRDALQQLPPDQRRSILLAYFGGYTQDEIARKLGVPLGTVKGRLRIGLQKMRGYLNIEEAAQ
jgi:RNA polymerase sigma-70 factor (ECF subfamily)